MAIDMTSSTGGLFRRLGRFSGTLLNMDAWRGPTLGSAVDFIAAQFDDTLQHVADRLYGARDSARGSLGGMARYLAAASERCLIDQVNADNPLPDRTLEYALDELLLQMESQSHTVLANTVNAVVTADPANSSDTQVIVSVLGPDGETLENVFPEDIVVICTNDSQNTATLGREPLLIEGEDAQSNPLAHDWPLGSGASLTLHAAPPTVDASSNHANHLTNSDFADFTSDLPDNWEASAGSAGVDIFEETSILYSGSSTLRLLGDGSTLVGVEQTFNDSDGTTKKLLPLTVYAVNCWVRVSTTPAAGVLALELIDGSDVVIQDAAGANNQITKDLAGVSTTFVPVQGFFRTPAVLPSTYKIRVHQSTAMDSGKSVYVSHLALVRAQQVYDGGPFVGIFSGADKLIRDDKWTIAMGNSAPDQSWNRVFDRFFGMRARGLQLPAGSSPTIPASWIGAF